MIGLVDDGGDRHRRAEPGGRRHRRLRRHGLRLADRRMPACPGRWRSSAALALGAALGFVNGWTVVRSGLHSFIITLASMSIFFGVMIFLTRAESFRELPPVFAGFGRLRLLDGTLSPLLLVAVAVAVLLVGALPLHRGSGARCWPPAPSRRPRPCPASASTASSSTATCCRALLAGIAALMLVARNGAAMPSMAGQLGQDWLLPAFLGPVLGGTLLSGGRVSVVGTFLGAVLVTLLTSGLLLLQVGEFWVQAFLGPAAASGRADGHGAPLVPGAAEDGLMDGDAGSVPLCPDRLVRPAAGHGRWRSSSSAPSTRPSCRRFNIQVLLLGDRGQRADRLLADDHHRDRPDEPVGRRHRRAGGDQLRRDDAGLGPAGADRGACWRC